MPETAIRPAAPPKSAPVRVRLKTERFLLGGVDPQSVSERFCDWLADPRVAEPLNRRPGRVSLGALRREFARANGISTFYIVIFTPDGQPIGYYMIARDALHRTATFNVLIGETDWWGKGVVLETRAALLDHFFGERGIEKAVGMPLARNFPAVFNYRRQGWRLEGTLRGQCRAAGGTERLDQFQFGMLASDWAALRDKVR